MEYKFYNLDLSYNQQEQVKAYSGERTTDPIDTIVRACERNLKISFAYNDYHDVTQMSVTVKDPEHDLHGLIVCIKHTDVETLINVLFWLLATDFVEIAKPEGKNDKYSW